MVCFLLLFPVLFQMISHSEVAARALDIDSIKSDLKNTNLTCTEDSCNNNESDSFSPRACHCGMHCVQLGTCCIDSNYAHVPQPKLKPSCRSQYFEKPYYMIDKCPSTDSLWSSLCHDEWNGEDNVQKLVPVTSLLTSITYKNYYCFRCHEANNEFLYWIVNIKSYDDPNKISEFEAKSSGRGISLTYKKDTNMWMAFYNDEVGFFNISISFKIPDEISNLVHSCEQDMISNCSEKWSDEDVRNKCHSYMAIKEIKRNGSLPVKYKNIHCALCNFENLNDIFCWKEMIPILVRTKIFSFTYLLDVNTSDGELVGKIQRCPDDQTWDPFSEKCRKLFCGLPEYKIKNGECVKE